MLEVGREALAQRSNWPCRAIGITNQRETIVVWDRATGEPSTGDRLAGPPHGGRVRTLQG